MKAQKQKIVRNSWVLDRRDVIEAVQEYLLKRTAHLRKAPIKKGGRHDSPYLGGGNIRVIFDDSPMPVFEGIEIAEDGRAWS